MSPIFSAPGFLNQEKKLYLHPENGRLAEWLGSGLQNRVRRFESAIDLNVLFYL
jgi:hypothetical protein